MLLHGFNILVLFMGCCTRIADGTGRPERVSARNGIVSTDETRCSEIGRNLLIQGGYAVDAAVAATLCLGVTSPAYSGLGGGGFMIIRLAAKGDAKVFDMREVAPGRASNDMYGKKDDLQCKRDPLSIAIPGQLAGLYTAHKLYGNLGWESIVKPSEDLARKGSNESPRLKKLADTLSAIAKNGEHVFYNGSIARGLVKEIRNQGGIITEKDFAKYRVITRKPLVADVGGYKVVTAPPPASGGAMMILILKILSNYNATGVPIPLGAHRAVEALKYALAMKMDLGDPEFVNVTNIVNDMISTRFAEKLKSGINVNRTFEPSYYGSKWSQVYDHGTTHICVVDKRRNVVTMTMSLSNYYGSGMESPSTGIYLNNEMCDFSRLKSSSLRPSPANFIKPYKRPLSSMAPAIFLKDGKVRVVIRGAARGLLIPDAVTQVLYNYFNLKMGPLDAVLAPRFYHKLYPDVLYVENYKSKQGERYVYGRNIMEELKRKGHQVVQSSTDLTVCQFVIQCLTGSKAGELVAVSDPRKGGSPAGY